MEKIYQWMDSLPEINEFNRIFNDTKVNVLVENTTEENAILLLSYRYQKEDRPFIVVCPNLYHAQMVYDRLSQVLSSKEVFFFPQDEFITSELLVSSMEFKMERIHTITNIMNKTKYILVTHLAGYLKPQRERSVWERSVFSLRIGDEMDPSELSRKLFEFGYTKEYVVEKPGDYSQRGGIIDIFLIGQVNPVRLDFFGDNIESMKQFDIETQRSIARIESIEVVPVHEFIYDETELNRLKKLITSKLNTIDFSQEAKKKISRDLDLLMEHQELDRLSRYLPFILEKQSTIASFAHNSVTIFMDYHRVSEQYEIMRTQIGDWYLTTDDYAKMGFDLLYPFNIDDSVSNVFFEFFEYSVKPKTDKVLSFFGKTPLSYQGNLDLLCEDVRTEIPRNTLILAISSKSSIHEIKSHFAEKGIPYCSVLEFDELRPHQINFIQSDKYFDLISDSLHLRVITESAIFKQRHLRRRGRYVSVFETSKRLSSVRDLLPGDFIVHYDFGIGKFLEVKPMELNGVKNDYIHIEYRDGDKLYIPLDSIHLIQKYSGSEGFVPRLSKLGGTDWQKAKQRVRAKARDIADQLIQLYSEREKAPGFSFQEFSELESDFENDFEYDETPDQQKAINEVLHDMTLSRPMDRLLCGDVGFGKTEVALRAAFRAVLNGKQVAYLAPTTVLSKQHYNTFVSRMEKYGINVRLLNRFVMPKDQKRTLLDLHQGKVDVLIGTHRILSNDVMFRDLGLLIIDEEQRFGVLHKERIKEIKVNIDVLSLSATPIPRTLQMAIMGVKNMSLLETAPENRYPIQTYVLERNDSIIKDSIERELMRNGQVFYLYNRIEDIEQMASKIQNLVPEARIQVAHGQMHKHELERVVEEFIAQEVDILLSTTIIETGIDIPNANTLIIHEADKLGLSQLYQIRGRVGRSSRIAYAYLMYHKDKALTEEATKRLQVIKEFTELGSGFKIAVRDLSIRGAGDVLGSEQSGFIDSVGVDLYMRILEEEVKIKQGRQIEEKPKKGAKTTVSKFIRENYIEDDFVKIEMHKKIQKVEKLAQVIDLKEEFIDRFGSLDEELEIYMYERLFEVLTQKIDVEKISESKTNITLVLTEEGTGNIPGDVLFSKGMSVSNLIRFAYRFGKIHIILDTVGLDKHWLYTMVPFLDRIVNQEIKAR